MKSKINALLIKLKLYWSHPPQGKHLTIKEMTAYSAGGMGINFILGALGMAVNAEMIPYFYHIPIEHGRHIASIVMIANLIVAPALGKLLDNTRAKIGKYRLFILILTPIVAVFSILASWIPQFSEVQARIIFAYATCIPALVLSAYWFAIYNMMPSAMTPNSQERVTMLSPAGLISSFAPTIMGIVVGPVRHYFYKQGAEYLAIRYLALGTIAIGAILTYLLVLYTKERVYIMPGEREERVKFIEGVRKVARNKPFLVWCISNIFAAFKVIVVTSMPFIALARYSSEYGQGLTIAALLSPIAGFGATPAMIIAPFLTRKFDKKTILIASNIFSVIIFAVVLIIGVGNIPIGLPTIIIMTAISFFNSFMAGIILVITPAISAEQFDYQQYLTGERLEGFMNGFGAWITGIAVVGLSYIPTILQKQIGFQVDLKEFNTELVYQPQNMAIAVKWFNTAVAIALISTLLWALILIFYKLDRKEHARVMEIISKKAVDTTFDIPQDKKDKSEIQIWG